VIKVLNFYAEAVFDTGACASTLCNKTLKKLENYIIEFLAEKKKFYLLDDSEIIVDKKVKLPVVYNMKEA
ncbi:hypothetical protein H311_02685, partial [Anncaliia algerae PRA109]